MADEILRVNKAQTTDRAGGVLWVQKGGAATPSTYDDFWILPDDLLAPEQARLAANEANIASNTARIVIIENSLTKTLNKNQNTAYAVTQNADSRIINFGFRAVSGVPIVAVGTGAGLDDIVSSKVITASERAINTQEYSTASRTVYITISGGIVDVVICSRENVYEV